MVTSFLKVFLRSFRRNPAFSLTNIFGLAIGIACFILTMVYIAYELSYDNFHKNSGRIFIVSSTKSYEDTFIENNTRTPSPLAEELRSNFPEVLTSARVFGAFNFVFQYEGKLFDEENIYAVDTTFFDVFSCEFIEGSPKNALSEQTSVVITESMAKKYFGAENAFGQVLKSANNLFKVGAVVKDPPQNSVISFDMLCSSKFLRTFGKWNRDICETYVVLNKGIDRDQLENKFPELIKEKVPQIQGQDINDWLAAGNRLEYHLISLKEYYLNIQGNYIYVFGFGIVALLLIIVACINYINLSTARASMRAKEIGVRMAIGASRKNLIQQFFGESLLVTFISTVLGMGIVEVFLPVLSRFLDKELSLHYFDNLLVLPMLFLLILAVGLLSGIYPAIVLSSFKPDKVLKGGQVVSYKRFSFRSILVFAQFSISILLIISLSVVYLQSNLLYKKNLGFDSNNLLIIKDGGSGRTSVKDKKDLFKEEVINLLGVKGVSATSRYISSYNAQTQEWFPANGGEGNLFSVMGTDPDYFKTMKLSLVSGRFFDKRIPGDSMAVVINESAVKILGYKENTNFKISNGKTDCKVIGVVKDFHFETLFHEIKPLIIFYHGSEYARGRCNIIVRYDPQSLDSIITKIDELWREYVPFGALKYSINNDYNKSFYKKEEQTSQLMFSLALVVLIITLIGLYGLALFSANERIKEVAIRKIAGGSVTTILFKMTWSLTKIVLLANVLAWPLAWFFMDKWLSDFAVRVNLTLGLFCFAAITSYVLSVLTISTVIFKAANRNPVEVLRYE